MAEEKVSELLAAEIRAETEKRLIRKLAEEGGGTWAAYMWMEIEAFFARTPTPVDVGEAEGRDLLFFASYCGDDNPACTPARPCDDCIAMSNVYRIPNGTRSLFQREFGASPSPPKADGPGEVSVKPLEWSSDDYDDDVRTEWFAVGLVGQYLVHHRDGDWRLVLDYASGDEMLQTYLGAFDTDSAAKAAAQSDYEARIRSALVPPSIKREA